MYLSKREMQIETRIKYHYIKTRVTKINRMDHTKSMRSIDKSVNGRLHITHGDVK